MLDTVRGSTLQGADVSTALDKNSCGNMVSLSEFVDRSLVPPSGKANRGFELGQDVDSDDMDEAAPIISGPAAMLFEGALGESPSKRRPPVPGWSSTTPTLKKMRSVARNLDEDLRSVSQAPTSSEAATRLSADKDDEDEEEDESNVSLLEGPNIMGSSPTVSSGSDTSTVV